MGKEDLFMQRGMFTLASGKTTSPTVTESTTTSKARNTQGNGIKINSTDRDKKSGLMAQCTKASTKTAKSTEKENSPGRMAQATRAPFKTMK